VIRSAFALILCALLGCVAGCSRGAGDACSDSARCDDGLGCVNDKCADCQKTDRCTLYGFCKANHNRCEVPAQSADECKQPQGTHKYVACEMDGKCSLVDGICAAASIEDCKSSLACKGSGACSAKDGRCIIAGDEDCKSSEICVNMAFCTFTDGRCALTSSDDCRTARGCKSSGLCTKRVDRCVAASDEDCKASTMCKAHGACVARAGSCASEKVE
jgi:hypothetical protein